MAEADTSRYGHHIGLGIAVVSHLLAAAAIWLSFSAQALNPPGTPVAVSLSQVGWAQPEKTATTETPVRNADNSPPMQPDAAKPPEQPAPKTLPERDIAATESIAEPASAAPAKTPATDSADKPVPLTDSETATVARQEPDTEVINEEPVADARPEPVTVAEKVATAEPESANEIDRKKETETETKESTAQATETDQTVLSETADSPPQSGGAATAATQTDAETASPSPDPALQQDYLSELHRALQQAMQYPHRAKRRRQEGIAWVEFTVYREGRLAQIQLQKSSGYPLLDEAALDTVRSIEQFKPLPEQMGRKMLTLAIPIRFQLR